MRSILRDFPTEKVKLIKKNGNVIKEIEALVDSKSKKIFIDDVRNPIEVGDKFLRNIPGAQELYIVKDPGYYPEFHGIPAHYQVSVGKEEEEKIQRPSTVIINNNGVNSRANIDSIDNSNNNYNSDNKLFDELRKCIEENIKDLEKNLILNNLNEMENKRGTNKFKESYDKFIQGAANHMTIIAPFIPKLTELLIK